MQLSTAKSTTVAMFTSYLSTGFLEYAVLLGCLCIYLALSYLAVTLVLNNDSINSIEKSRLNADSFSYSGSDVAWKARLVLFLGFALMAGGLAGSVVVLIIKYIVEHYDFELVYFGIANVVANGLIMLRWVFPEEHIDLC